MIFSRVSLFTALMVGMGLLSAAYAQTPSAAPQLDNPSGGSSVPAPLKSPVRNAFKPLWVSLGLFAPLDGTYNGQPRNDDTAWGLVDISYDLPNIRKTPFHPASYVDYGISADYVTTDSDNNIVTGGGTGEGHAFVGIGLADHLSLLNVRNAFRLYAGAGGGMYEVNAFHSTGGDTDTSDPEDDVHYDKFSGRLGYKLFSGIQFHKGMYAEVSYHDIGSMDGFAYRGFAFSGGERF